MERRHYPREQDPTEFSKILDWLCLASGACCAALVDAEGETVDYGGRGDPFDIRVVAAELRLLQQRVSEAKHLSPSLQLVIRAKRKSFLLEALPEGYALALQLPRCATGISERALGLAVRRLCEEAGFPVPPTGVASWRSIDVEETPGRSHRPAAVSVGGQRQPLLVLGRLAGEETTSREAGYRVRLGSGQEGNLIREALGRWYIEDEG